MDRIGTGSRDQFENFSFEQVYEYVKWELEENCLFTASNRIYRQIRGVAIGGALSAQLSCLYCVNKEHAFYSQTASQMRTQITQHIPPSLLPHHPFRFRDNLVGVARGRPKLPKVQALFERIYGLKLQEEGHGLNLQTLESHLTIDPHTGHISVALKDKISYHHNPEPTRLYVRYPDVYSPNAQNVLRSLIPALALKCTYYQTDWDSLQQNCLQTIQELHTKGYLGRWWEGSFKTSLIRFGFPEEHTQQLHRWVQHRGKRVQS